MSDLDREAATPASPERAASSLLRELVGETIGPSLAVQPSFTLSSASLSADAAATPSSRSLGRVCRDGIRKLERETGRRFAAAEQPLLVSVRPAGASAIPGQARPVLNVGLGEDAAAGLRRLHGGELVSALTVRLLATFAVTVRGVPLSAVHDAQRAAEGDLRRLGRLLRSAIEDQGEPLPEKPERQLVEAVAAMLASWGRPEVRRCAAAAGLDGVAGSVVVQAMPYANLDEHSGRGVAFTRDPVSGVPGLHGQFTPCSQGGIAMLGDPRPEPLMMMARRVKTAFASLQSELGLLEAAERDMCEMSFVVESGDLRVLSAQPGARSGPASIRVAVDLVDAGMLSEESALRRISPAAMRDAQRPVLRRDHSLEAVLHGAPASPGTACGAALIAGPAGGRCARDPSPILFLAREVDAPLGSVADCGGVVIGDAGYENETAMLARSLGIPAICDTDLAIAPGGEAGEPPSLLAGGTGGRIREREGVVLDADSGVLYRGTTRLVAAQPDPSVARVLAWCTARARVPVAEQPPEGHVAVGTVAAARALGRLDATPVLIELNGDDPDSAWRRGEIVDAALAAGAESLILRWGDDMGHGSGEIPPAPWSMIVAPASRHWAALLLASRIPVRPRAEPRRAGR